MSAIPQEDPIRRVRLWFGLLGGAIAWTVHFMSAYAVAEFGCVGRLDDVRYGNISLVAWLEAALTVAAVLLSAAATATAYDSQLRLHSQPASTEAERYMARAGLYASGIFTFVILFESIPIFFYLRSC